MSSLTAQTLRFLQAAFDPRDIVELRLLCEPPTGVISGLFDKHDTLAQVAREMDISGVKGTYYTLNPVTSGKVLNSLIPQSRRTTSDKDIAERNLILIDCDPIRPSGVCSTEQEKREAIRVADSAQEFLSSHGWPEPIRVDSGNGIHLLYRMTDNFAINSRNDDHRLRAILNVVADACDTPTCKVDRSVFNASRIARLPGTTNRKGPNTPDRPHRPCSVISTPHPLGRVTPRNFLDVESLAPPAAPSAPMPEAAADEEDIRTLIEEYPDHFTCSGVRTVDGIKYFDLEECPFKGGRHSNQTQRKTCIILGETVGFKCFSDDCSDKTMRDLLDLLYEETGEYPSVDIYKKPTFVKGIPVDDDDWTPETGVSTPPPEREATAEELRAFLESYVPPKEEPHIPTGDESQFVLTKAPVPAIVQVSDYSSLAYGDELEPDWDTLPFTPVPYDPDFDLAMPVDCMYGRLGHIAQTLDAPIGPAYMSLLAAYSARGVNGGDEDVSRRASIYVALVGAVGDGKSIVTKRATKGAELTRESGRLITSTPASDPGLLNLLKTDKDDPFGDNLGSVLLLQDELDILLKKASIENSTLASLLCQMWSSDHAGAADRSKVINVQARLSILGCLPMESPSDFPMFFGAMTRGGLYSRFLIAPFPSNWKADWDWDREWAQRLRPLLREPRDCYIPRSIKEMHSKWGDDCRAAGLISERRAEEHARRVAIIAGSANGDREVTTANMTAALNLMKWQMRVKSIYTPGLAQTQHGRIAEDILAGFEAWHRRNGYKMITWKTLNRKHNWTSKYGMIVFQTLKGLVNLGEVCEEVIENKRGSHPTGRYCLDKYRKQTLENEAQGKTELKSAA